MKRKALSVSLEMVTSRNVEDVVLFLKKQLQSTMDQEFDKVSGVLKPAQPPDARRIWSTASFSSKAYIHARSSSQRLQPMWSTSSWTFLATLAIHRPSTSSYLFARWWRSFQVFVRLSPRSLWRLLARSNRARCSEGRCGLWESIVPVRQVSPADRLTSPAKLDQISSAPFSRSARSSARFPFWPRNRQVTEIMV